MFRIVRQYLLRLESVLLLLLILTAGGIALYVQTTMTNISKALGPEVLEQQQAIAYLLQDLSELTRAVQSAFLQPSPDNISTLHVHLLRATQRLDAVRDSYSFDSLTGAAGAHAIVNPALQDVERWLDSGIANHSPMSPVVHMFVESRARDAHLDLQRLFDSSNARAAELVDGQSTQLGRLRDSVVLYLAVIPILAAGLIVLYLRQRKTQSALREREQQYRTIFESTSDGLFICASAERFVDVNPTGCEMFGLDRDDLLHVNPDPKRLVHADSMPSFKQISEAISAGREWHGELQGVRHDGSAFDIEIFGTPYTIDGDHHYLASVRDVTERKIAERALAHSVRELEAFADSVAHDLKAPLRAMGGFSQILLDDYHDRLDDTGRESLNYIVSGASRMGELIDDLLAYSRVGRGGLVFGMVDLEQVIADVEENLAADISATDAVIRVMPGLPKLEGHRGILDQVFQNLIANSIKFTEPGRSPEIVVSCASHSGWHVLSVSDNGIGIDKHLRGNVFEIFHRLHTSDEYEGTGIGLAIVKKGVLLHGGSIRVEESAHGGSTFVLRLPAKLTDE